MLNKLQSLDLSSFDTSKVVSMYKMFYGCSKIKTIYVSEWSTAGITIETNALLTGYLGSGNMFGGCSSLVGGSGTGYDSSKTDKEYGRIDGGSETPGYLTEKQ